MVIVCVIVVCLVLLLVDEFIGNFDSVYGVEVMCILCEFNVEGIMLVMVMYLLEYVV